MSEKIYAWLLRLYPSSFRKAYGEEALQLFRDRERDERGFLSGLRLWLDMLADLIVTLPRGYRFASAAAASQATYSSSGIPSFHMLEVEAFSFRSLCYGGVASLVVYSAILILVGHGRGLHAAYAGDSQRASRASYTIPRRQPMILLSYAPARPSSGAVVTLTATVSAVGGETPTGSVRFVDGITVLSVGELEGGKVTVTAKLPRSTTHTLRATYLGNDKYTAASSTERKP